MELEEKYEHFGRSLLKKSSLASCTGGRRMVGAIGCG